MCEVDNNEAFVSEAVNRATFLAALFECPAVVWSKTRSDQIGEAAIAQPMESESC